jgi:hypothetical protein
MSLHVKDRSSMYLFSGAGGTGPFGSHLDAEQVSFAADTSTAIVKGSIQSQGILWYGSTRNDVGGNTYLMSGYNYSILSPTLAIHMHASAIDTQALISKGSLLSNANGAGTCNAAMGYVETASRLEALSFANDTSNTLIKASTTQRNSYCQMSAF